MLLIQPGILIGYFAILPLLPVPQYRRAYIPGSTVFLTLITYQRIPLFTTPTNITYPRQARNTILVEMPFQLPT